MTADKTTRAFVQSLVDQRLLTHDLDHLLALEHLLAVAVAERWTPDRLSASFASVLATSPLQWEKIERACQDFVLQGLPSGVKQADLRIRVDAPEPPGVRAKLRERAEPWIRRLARASTATWISLLLVGLLAGVAGVVAFVVYGGGEVEELVVEPDEPSSSSTTAEPTDEPDEPPDPSAGDDGAVLEPMLVEGESPSLAIRLDQPTSLEPVWLLVALGLVSALLAGLGVAWLFAPRDYREFVRKRDEEALGLRAKRGIGEIPYFVERFAPFDEGRMDGAASILARIGAEARGFELDVVRTVQRTLDLGLPAPVMQATHAARELLVLVDVEHGGHPFFDGVEWLLTRWRRSGLHFVRFDFAHRPARLETWPERLAFDLDEVARRTEGMPMMLFSRGVELAYEHQVPAPWLERASAWPLRVFVDLDPRVPSERNSAERKALAEMRDRGFLRVPFTPDGLDAAVRHLAGARAGAGRVIEEPLAPLADINIEVAIARWVAGAACVPDPTWAQMEAIRRHFPELANALPDPRYLQRAIEWLRGRLQDAKLGHDPTKDGKRLAVGPLGIDLRVEQTERDTQLATPNAAQFVTQARALILHQLGGAKPKATDPARGMWDLRVAYQHAMLEPAKADELLHIFFGTAQEGEMLRLADELAREQASLHSPGAKALMGRVRSETEGGQRIPTLKLRPSLRRIGLVSTIGLGVGGISSLVWLAIADRPVAVVDVSVPADMRLLLPDVKLGGECDFGQPLAIPAPPTGGLGDPSTGRACASEVALATTEAPIRLVRLSGGEFTMGERSDSDEDPHRVALSRFAIGATEVSVKQYELVMGNRPSNCNLGCDADHPVQTVSWFDAVKFMNALTKMENDRRKGVRLTPCYDEATWVWNPGCTGYRLPTEAEWEYAARAGSTATYSFGEDAKEICKSANVRSEDCDDGFENLAPVETLRPNAWGLHEMHGNVWEWVFDGYDSEFYSSKNVVNPVNTAASEYQALRGGAFDFRPVYSRSANRLRYLPGTWNRFYGFRCARGAVQP